jgi:hypothetical protein
MQPVSLESSGFQFYLNEMRRGSTEAYVAYRICEHSWRISRDDAVLLRRAVIRLIETDPWFLATAMPHVLQALETADLERLTPFVGAGPARRVGAALRAVLWYHRRRGPYHPDQAGRVQLQRALAFLQKVPRKQRARAWHEMLVGCYRALDYQKYKRAFARLLLEIPSEEQASALHDFFNAVASGEDWPTYDRHRREWDRLPLTSHVCECYLNDLYTNDGLRAVAAQAWEAAAEAVVQAASVRGCPHLNSGGLRLDLVRILISKKRNLDAARAYLDAAAAFGGDPNEIEIAKKKLNAALTRRRSRPTPEQSRSGPKRG